MASGKAISLFLIDGVPDGRIACELFNWTGKGYKIPRRLLKESSERADLRKAGVYFLFGRDEGRNEVSSVYIGEAEEVFKRIMQHQDKEFWSEVLLFVSKDDNLNKAHIKYLEFSIHSAAEAVGRLQMVNGNTPNCPVISESEQAVMKEFFENLKLLTSSLGYRLFEPLASPAASFEDQYFIKAARGANASAVLTNEGIVVRKASAAAGSSVPSTPEPVIKLRERLIQEGVLVASEDCLTFAKDHLFASPSTAAAVVLGRSANGRIEWKDANGTCLKDNEE